MYRSHSRKETQMTQLAYLACTVLLAIPVPPIESQNKSEKELMDVVGKEIESAKSIADFSAIAKQLLEISEQLEDNDSDRYVTLLKAKEFAIKAKDNKTAIKAVEGLARFEGESSVERGHELWGPDKIAASEIYFRALPVLSGINKSLVEKRLEELGWKSSQLTTDDVKRLFGLDNTWEADNETLKGKVGDVLSNIVGSNGWRMHYFDKPIKSLEFSFQIKSKGAQGIRIDIEQSKLMIITATHNNTATLICRHKFPHGIGNTTEYVQQKIDLEVWHTFHCTINEGTAEFKHDGKNICKLDAFEKTQNQDKYKIGIGFGSHEQEVEIKNIIIK